MKVDRVDRPSLERVLQRLHLKWSTVVCVGNSATLTLPWSRYPTPRDIEIVQGGFLTEMSEVYPDELVERIAHCVGVTLGGHLVITVQW